VDKYAPDKQKTKKVSQGKLRCYKYKFHPDGIIGKIKFHWAGGVNIAESIKGNTILSVILAGYLSTQRQTAIVLEILLDFILYGDFC
jgi:hypothetical protein